MSKFYPQRCSMLWYRQDNGFGDLVEAPAHLCHYVEEFIFENLH